MATMLQSPRRWIGANASVTDYPGWSAGAHGARRRLRRPVRPADRPPRAGGAGVLRDRARHTVASRRSSRASPPAVDPLRRAGQRVRRRARRSSTRRCSTAGVPVFGICYGFQAMAQALGGDGRAGRHPRVRPHRADRRRAACCTRACPARHPVWMSHGDAVVRAPDGFEVTAASERGAPVAAFENRDRAAGRACSTTPRSAHSPHGQQVLSRFLHEFAGHRRGAGRPRRSSTSTVEAGARPDRRRPGDLRAVRRRRLRGGRRARPARHRRPADLRVRRPRAAAGGRARAGGARLRRRHRRQPAHRRRRGPVPRRARRGDRPRGQAQDHRPRVHPGVRGARRPRSPLGDGDC